MREFFRGWRRKAGIVSLVMACAASLLGPLQCEREARRRMNCMNNLSWPPKTQRSYGDILHEQRRMAYAEFSYLPSVAVTLTLTLLSACLILWPQQKPSPN